MPSQVVAIVSALPRKVGRPRDETLTRAILDVALDAYTDLGWSGFNFDVVSKRAGAGKAALYARWPDREALLFDAVAKAYPAFEAPDASLHEQLIALGHHVLDVHADHLRSAVLWTRLRADQATYDRVFEKIDQEIIQSRVRDYHMVVRHAVARGELVEGAPVMIMLDMFAGGLINYVLYSPKAAAKTLNQSKAALIERFALGAIAAARGLSELQSSK